MADLIKADGTIDVNVYNALRKEHKSNVTLRGRFVLSLLSIVLKANDIVVTQNADGSFTLPQKNKFSPGATKDINQRFAKALDLIKSRDSDKLLEAEINKQTDEFDKAIKLIKLSHGGSVGLGKGTIEGHSPVFNELRDKLGGANNARSSSSAEASKDDSAKAGNRGLGSLLGASVKKIVKNTVRLDKKPPSPTSQSGVSTPYNVNTTVSPEELGKMKLGPVQTIKKEASPPALPARPPVAARTPPPVPPQSTKPAAPITPSGGVLKKATPPNAAVKNDTSELGRKFAELKAKKGGNDNPPPRRPSGSSV